MTNCRAINGSWGRSRSYLRTNFANAEEAASALIERYQQGWAVNTLCREFHVHRDTIKNLLLDNNIQLRTKRYRNLQEARPGWEKVFSKPSPAALYWAGFLMADGSIIRRDGEPVVQCRIGLLDRAHITALCNFVGRGKPLTANFKGQAHSVGWQVISQRMADDLARWGIVPGKGKLIDVSPLGEACMSVDFWRGMIDGDGSIGITGTSPKVQLTGRLGISVAFIRFVAASIPLHHHGRNKKLKVHKYPKGGGTKVILNGQNAVSLCDLLYVDVPEGLYLSRKRSAALEVIKRYYGRGEKGWEKGFEALVAYKERFGQCNVTKNEDRWLGAWCNKQKFEYRTGRLSEWRIQRLEALGFDFVLEKVTPEALWEQMYGALNAHKECFGRCNVTRKEDRQLGAWCNTQRQAYITGRLSLERTTRLEALEFIWKPEEVHWQQMYEALAAYKRRFKHCHVPRKWEEEPKLGYWCLIQRSRNRNGTIDKTQVERLEALGFDWDSEELNT